jgi:hypothetical protein
MTFPYTPLPQKMEILLGGVWTDITSYVRRVDRIVEIKRGRSAEASSVEPTEVGFDLNNRDGRFTSRNPTGPYFGQFGRNTRGRSSLPYGSSYLLLPGSSGDRASCPDAAALDITSDIDIRIDVSLLSWRAPQNLCGKHLSSGNQASWVLQTNSLGRLCLSWTTDGIVLNEHVAMSDIALPVPADHRQAVRATLDVNNGASGHTATFYYSDTISGTWVQLGSAVTISGTTSIFSSTATVTVGDTTATTAPLANGQPLLDFDNILYETVDPPTGFAYGFQLRSGIAGSVVANPDFTIQAAGAASFADTSSPTNTWTPAGNSVLDDRDYRASFEISAWPQSWDTTGTDIWTSVAGGGILRRLGAGRSVLKSCIARELGNLHDSGTVPLAYWPCEDKNGSTSIASGLPAGQPMSVVGSPDYEASEIFACSGALPAVSNSTWLGKVSGAAAQVRFLYEADSGAVADASVIMRIATSKPLPAYVEVIYNTAGGGTLKAVGYNHDGTAALTAAATSPSGGLNGKVCRWGVGVVQSGGNVALSITVSEVGSDTAFSNSATAAGTAGTIRSVTVTPSADVDQAIIGHISVHTDVSAILNINGDFLDAFRGEMAGRRIERILGEEGISFQRWGNLDTTMAMGSQRPGALTELLEEAADTDGGLIYEPRNIFGIGYRTRASMYGQPAVLTIDYAANELFEVPDPTDDDRYTRNDIEVSNTGGSSGRATRETGSLNISQPEDDPEGIGTYPGEQTVNTEDDSPLVNIASWLVNLGTVDEERYPKLTVNLANARIAADSAIVAEAQLADVGEVILLDNLPAFLPPDSTRQMIQNIIETMGNFEHSLSYDCSPSSPWSVSEVGANDYIRADGGSSTLSSSATSTATSISVATSSGPVWTTDHSQPAIDLAISGEVLTVVGAGTVVNVADDPLLLAGNIAGWTGSNSAISYDTTIFNAARGGAASVKCIPNGVSASGGVNSTVHTPVASVTAGASYTASGWVYAPLGWTDLRTAVDWYTSADAFVSSSLGSATSVPAATWTFLSQTFVAPATSSRAVMRGRWGTTPASTDLFYWWNLRLTADASVTTTSPQTMTVGRSRNGVVKAQASGAVVRLNHPARAGL